MMAVNVNEKIRKLGPAQRKKGEARAAELIAEEMTLRELRRARKLTQVRMAKALGISQDSVSRLENRSDFLLSTLQKTVKAMGGNLSLIAKFPDRAPVVLSGIAGVIRRPSGQIEKTRRHTTRSKMEKSQDTEGSHDQGTGYQKKQSAPGSSGKKTRIVFGRDMTEDQIIEALKKMCNEAGVKFVPHPKKRILSKNKKGR